MKHLLFTMGAFALVCLETSARADVVLWAGAAGGPGNHANIVGPPDGKAGVVAFPGDTPAVLSAFGPPAAYSSSGLNALLGVTLAPGDLFGFDLNGGGSPPGGWESARFLFSDGVNSVSVNHDQTVASDTSPLVISQGDVTHTAYASVFHITAAFSDLHIGFIVFRVPTIDTTSPNFTVTIQAGNDPSTGLPGEGTPDPDAFGLVTAPEPSSLTLLGLGGSFLVGYAWKRRKLRVVGS